LPTGLAAGAGGADAVAAFARTGTDFAADAGPLRATGLAGGLAAAVGRAGVCPFAEAPVLVGAAGLTAFFGAAALPAATGFLAVAGFFAVAF